MFSICEQAPGASDHDILQKANQEDWVIITNDKDFGEKAYRDRLPHRGIVLLRLRDERSISKVDVLERLLSSYSNDLTNAFVVVTEHQVRFAQD